MFSQNTQDAIQQSLFVATSMKVTPTIQNAHSTRSYNMRHGPAMAVARPQGAGNFKEFSLNASKIGAAPGAVSRGNMTVSMSM